MFEGLATPGHLLLLLFIAILFFGPAKLGDFGKGLGDGIRHFKDALKEGSAKPEPSATAAKSEAPANSAENKQQ